MNPKIKPEHHKLRTLPELRALAKENPTMDVTEEEWTLLFLAGELLEQPIKLTGDYMVDDLDFVFEPDNRMLQ